MESLNSSRQRYCFRFKTMKFSSPQKWKIGICCSFFGRHLMPLSTQPLREDLCRVWDWDVAMYMYARSFW